MTKFELIKKVASEAGVSQANCEKLLDALIIVMTDYLVRGERVLLKNFMSFETKEMGERICKHPQTGEQTTFPAVKYIKCRISNTLRDAINQR